MDNRVYVENFDKALKAYEIARYGDIKMKLTLTLVESFVPLYDTIAKILNGERHWYGSRLKEFRSFIEDTLLFINTGKRELRSSLWVELVNNNTGGDNERNHLVSMPPVKLFIKGFFSRENGVSEFFEFCKALKSMKAFY